MFVRTYDVPTADEVVFHAMTRTADGGFAATGYYRVATTQTAHKNVFVAKFTSDGQLSWWKGFGGAGDEEGRGIIETNTGHLLIVGYTTSLGSDQKNMLLSKWRTEPPGPVWTRYWRGGIQQDEELSGVLQATNGEIWVVGYTRSLSPSPAYHAQLVLARLSPDEQSLIGRRIGNPSLGRAYQGYALAEVFGSYPGFCVVGSVNFSTSSRDALLAKFDSSGAFLWADAFGETGREETAFSIVRTSDAGLAIVGGDRFDGQTKNGFLVKTDAQAQIVWARRSSGSGKVVQETLANELLVTGHHYVGTGVRKDYLSISKWNLGGQPSWSGSFEPLPGSLSIGNAVCLHLDGRFTVGGTVSEGAQYRAIVASFFPTGVTCLFPAYHQPWAPWTSTGQRRISPAPDAAQFSVSLVTWPQLQVAHLNVEETPICGSTVRPVTPEGSIQAAIDAAHHGDVIQLAPGTFQGTGNRDLDFRDKWLTLRSATGRPEDSVIDCRGEGRGFQLVNSQNLAVVEGITIRNGTAPSGGGVYCSEANVILRNCVIEDCDGEYGAGIYATETQLQVDHCVVRDCGFRTPIGGGVVYLAAVTDPVLRYCVVTDNAGDGIAVHSGTNVAIDHCTVANNGDSGVLVWSSDVIVQNTIAWGNRWGISVMQTVPPTSSVTVHCSDIQGGWPGPGGHNINLDPRFVAPEMGDYRLRMDSPCIPLNQPVCGLIGALGVISDGPWEVLDGPPSGLFPPAPDQAVPPPERP